jgi:DNA-binding MarR family transcriptional regulator
MAGSAGLGSADVAPTDLTATAVDLLDTTTLIIRALSSDRELSLTAGDALRRLARLGPQRITALAKAENVTQPAMTGLVQRLEERGLVVRIQDPGDRRSWLVGLTGLGRTTLATRRRRNVEHVTELLSDLSEQEIQTVSNTLAFLLPALRARVGVS